MARVFFTVPQEVNGIAADREGNKDQAGELLADRVGPLDISKIMFHLHFNLALIEFLADHRNPFMTDFFLFFTALGETNGYIIVATLIYVLWDKKLALRLSVLVLLASCFDQGLKLVIKNPRPFVTQHTYFKKWAISHRDMPGLATDYSTPSGHAICSTAFYPYLYAFTSNRIIRACCIVAPILIGLSRPYLGVHYVEDVIIGWVLGLVLSAAAFKYTSALEKFWEKIGYERQIAAAVIASGFSCVVVELLNNGRLDSQERTFMSYAGFITGIVIAHPLEMKYVRFNPLSSSPLFKALRYILSVALVIGSIELLDKLFNLFAGKTTVAGDTLEYVRYTIAGIISIYAAPLIFTRLGLAD